MRSLSFLFFGVVLAACGGASTPDLFEGGNGTDGSTTGDGSSGGDGSMSGEGGMCPNGMFPTFDKGCTSTDNCVFGLHQIDCCGTQSAIGFNHSFKDMFDNAEKAWRMTCPGCGCPAGPTKTESGMTCDADKVRVQCVMNGGMSTGKCTTSCN